MRPRPAGFVGRYIVVADLANAGRSTPDLERQLPHDVPVLREPFSADQLRVAVRYLLP
jgi:hypothetical protein